MTWTDVTTARGGERLATTFDHVDTHVIEVRAGHLAGASDTNVVRGVRADAARSVSDEQVVPAIVIDLDWSFGVDRDVARHFVGVKALTGFRIELHQTDVSEIRTVGQPQTPIWIEQY